MLVEVDASAGGDERERNFVRLLDEVTFERMASFELMPTEAACSILTLKVPAESGSSSAAPQTLVVVGTAFSRADEPEPTSGRLLVFDASDRGGGAAEGRAQQHFEGPPRGVEAGGKELRQPRPQEISNFGDGLQCPPQGSGVLV